MDRSTERSLALFPGGSNGEFNLPPELAMVIDRGEGCQLWDTEGRRFLDFSLGWGSVLVGHAHPEIVQAVVRRAPLGSNFSYITEESVLLAEALRQISPACERIRFCASGTEATMYCLRLARAVTGRPKVLKFEGAYHGAHELGITSLFPSGTTPFPQPEADSAGTDPVVAETVLTAPFNDLETTAEIVAAHASQLAAIIVEPLQRCLPPKDGFLAGLRDLTRRHGLLLIFDEVVTGFRLAYGGAQQYYGVVPDLVAYGKALGGGYPIGAYGGRADILNWMDESRQGSAEYVWSASTLGGNPISCAAARAALRVLSADGVYPHLHALGKRLREGMRQVLADRGIDGQVIGDGPLAQVVFTPREVRNYRDALQSDRKLARSVMLELFRRGIFLNPMGTKLYLSIAHQAETCDAFLDRFADALEAVHTTAS